MVEKIISVAILMSLSGGVMSQKIAMNNVKIPSSINDQIFTEEFLQLQRFYESSNNQNAISTSGAIGVAQFMPKTWSWLKHKKIIPSHYSINNEKHQIRSQRLYMEYLYNRPWKPYYDSYRATIASYNCGRGKVLRLMKNYFIYWELYLPLETKNYLKKLTN
jgi:hypothetical protein